MKSSWLMGAFVTFIIGFLLTVTVIGSIIGIPLMLLSLLILVLGIIIPERRKKIIHIHKHRKK